MILKRFIGVQIDSQEIKECYVIRYYMDSAKTVKATIRIPKELALSIDSRLMPHGLYTSRPDFIVSAARQHALQLSEAIFSTWDDLQHIEQHSNRLYHFKECMGDILIDSQKLYGKYKGDPVTVILRISPGLVRYIWEIIEYGPKYYNLQDFVRGAIARYIQDDFRAEIRYYETATDIDNSKDKAKLERGDGLEERIDSQKEDGPKKTFTFIRRDGPTETITSIREDGTEEITTYLKGDGTEERADHVEGFDPLLFSLKFNDLQHIIDRKSKK